MQTLFEDFNLTEGLNLGVSQYLNKSGEAREAINCDLSIPGELARQLGYSSYGSGLDASPVLGLYDYTTSSIKKWIAVTGTVIYYDNSGTWTSAATGLTSGKYGTFATHLDTLIYTNLYDSVKKSTNGTSFGDLGGSPPKAKYVVTFDNKVYLLNIESYPSRMRWSDDGTTETWTSTNVQDVSTNIGIGDEITGGTVNNNNLLIFKNYSVWKWNASELRAIHTTVGCRSPRSIVTVDDWSFWASHKGFMGTNGGKPFRISNAVAPFFNAISDITAIVGWSEDNIVHWYIGTVTVNGLQYSNCILLYNYDTNAWSVKTSNDAITQAAILTTSGNVRSAYIGSSLGQVYKFKDGITDNTAAIPFTFVGAPYMSGIPFLQKDYKYLYVYLDRTSNMGIEVYYSVDFKDFRKLGTATDVVSELQFPSGVRGFNIRLKYATNTTVDQQKILGHVCLGDVLPGRLGNVT